MDALRLVEYDRIYFELSKKWLSDEELIHLTHTNALISEEERLAWFESLPQRVDYLIWGVEYEGQPIGAGGLKHIADKKAEYWGYIGEKNYWGKGLGKVLMGEIVKKAKELELTTICLRVRKYNPRAYSMYLKYGFTVDNETEEVYCMSLDIHN